MLIKEETQIPEEETIERAREDEREGKAPSTQAGEFVREEVEHIREGKHGARSTKQAIAIGLSKARRAGVKLPPPKKGAASKETRRKAKRDLKRERSMKAKELRESARAPLRKHSSAKVDPRLQNERSPDKLVPPLANAAARSARRQQRKLLAREQRNKRDYEGAFFTATACLSAPQLSALQNGRANGCSIRVAPDRD